MIKWKKFIEKDDLEQLKFVSLCTQNCHHMLVFLIGTYNYITTECKHGYPFAWYLDDLCFIEVDKRYANAVCIAIGYLIYDSFNLVFI